MLLSCERTERRLFGAILCEPGVLEACSAVEIYDFSDLHLHFAFMAIRNLQAREDEIDILSVERELWHSGYIQVDIARVGDTAHEPDYRSDLLVQFDARWLRRLANRRRNV